MTKPMRKRHNKIIVLLTAIAAVLLITSIGFSSVQDLSGAGTGFMVFSGFALTAPALMALFLFGFLIYKIRE